MIIYVTKKIAERYRIGMCEKASNPMKEIVDTVIKKERGDALFEWGEVIRKEP